MPRGRERGKGGGIDYIEGISFLNNVQVGGAA